MMTREEAIAEIEKMSKLGSFTRREALKIALSALRPVSREQVEKVFLGCPLCKCGGLDYAGFDSDGLYFAKPPAHEKFRFCPACGKPLTDEAVEMVMERLEALKDGNGV